MKPYVEMHDFLRSRRSVRRFRETRIPDEVLLRILTTATFAPSAHNRQPWRFAAVSNAGRKAQLADAMSAEYQRDLLADSIPEGDVLATTAKARARIISSPLVVILCMDTSEMDSYHDASRADAERVMAIQSTANAGNTLLLAAHAEGLGAAWNCAPLFAPQSVRSALGLPKSWEPQAMILLGEPAETPPPKPRKPLATIAVLL